MTETATVGFYDSAGLCTASVNLANATGVAADLREFLRRVASAAGGRPHETRFNEPQVLAARYVAWKTGGSIASVTVSLGAPSPKSDRYLSVYCHAVPSMQLPDVSEW